MIAATIRRLTPFAPAMTASPKALIAAGAIAGFLGVALGAFAAHGLKSRLDTSMLTVFQTGVTYQMYHALALLLVGTLLMQRAQPLWNWAGWAFMVGIVVFSGSLYALALSGIRTWGAVTPIGGLAFLLGWMFLLTGALRP